MTNDEVRELYDRYGYLVHRRCLALLGNATDANDALQETFLRVMKYGPTQVASTLAWLYGIATRVCFDQLDRRRRTEPWPARALAQLGEVFGPRTAADPELALAIGAELARLTAPVREMVILRHLEGLTQEEIAARTGYSRKWVGTKLREADGLLQAALGPAA